MKINMSKENKIELALTWAKAQLGKYVQPCRTIGCKYNPNQVGDVACKTPNPAPDADDVKKDNAEDNHPFWNFYCMRFVRTAYGAPPDYPKAEDMYQTLKQKGLIKTDTNIPVGALIFWHWSIFGHVGIHGGNGKVIHTGVNPKLKKKGIRESQLEEITEVLNGYNIAEGRKTSYLGWAYPPESWLR